MWYILFILILIVIIILAQKKRILGGYEDALVDYTLGALKGTPDYDLYFDERKHPDPYVKENQIGRILKGTDKQFFDLCAVLTKYYPRGKVLKELENYKNDKTFFKKLGKPGKEPVNKYIGNELVHILGMSDLREIDLMPKYLNIGSKETGKLMADKLGIKLHNEEKFKGKLPYKDNEFTLISAVHTFENNDAFISEVRRCLKPGGRFFIKDADARNGIQRMIIDIDEKLAGRPHRETYSWEELLSILANEFGEASVTPGGVGIAYNIN